MNPIEWLEQQVPGFGELPDDDRQAILHFALLWSLFEARVLQARASASSILSAVHNQYAEGRLKADEFQHGVSYFRQRYFAHDAFTILFDGLNLRSNDSPELVKQVLRGENNDPADVVACLLIVIFRLRNNLFHGVKWAYGIQGQRSNFEQANAALICAIAQFAPLGV